MSPGGLLFMGLLIGPLAAVPAHWWCHSRGVMTPELPSVASLGSGCAGPGWLFVLGGKS